MSDYSKLFTRSFMSRVEKGSTSGCWFWKGSQVVRNKGQSVTPSRFAYETAFGPIPKEGSTRRQVRRTCNGSTCVNPEHLQVIGGQFSTYLIRGLLETKPETIEEVSHFAETFHLGWRELFELLSDFGILRIDWTDTSGIETEIAIREANAKTKIERAEQEDRKRAIEAWNSGDKSKAKRRALDVWLASHPNAQTEFEDWFEAQGAEIDAEIGAGSSEGASHADG